MEKKVSHVIDFLSNDEVQRQLGDPSISGISFSFDIRTLLKKHSGGNPQFFNYSMRDSFHEWCA